MTFEDFVNFFFTLLVICNPISGLSFLLSLSQGRSAEEKHKIAITTGIAVIVVLLIVTFTGPLFLEIFGISLGAFQVAGGFVIFLLALSMLRAEQSRIRQTREDEKEATHKESIAVVPLAIPIIAGPGAMSKVIVTVTVFPAFLDLVYIGICCALVGIFIGGFLFFAFSIEKMLGQTGINLVNRIAGLIMSAMGMQIIAKGILSLFPGLGAPP